MRDMAGDKQGTILGLEDRVQILTGWSPGPRTARLGTIHPQRNSPPFKLLSWGLGGED